MTQRIHFNEFWSPTTLQSTLPKVVPGKRTQVPGAFTLMSVGRLPHYSSGCSGTYASAVTVCGISGFSEARSLPRAARSLNNAGIPALSHVLFYCAVAPPYCHLAVGVRVVWMNS